MKDIEINERFEAVKEIATTAGKHAMDFFINRSKLIVQNKGHQDFVTEADKTIEREITKSILDQFPNDSVYGEEMGGLPSDATWVIDPIDGTSNFIHGIPYFCISIAFIRKIAGYSGEDDSYTMEIGAIYDPVTDELFSALKGHGAHRDDVALQAGTCENLSKALIGLGYSQRTDFSEYSHLIERLLMEGCEYRRFGSAALMLAHVADGRIDGYYEKHLNSWDALAGLLINQEAGAYVASFLEKEAITKGNETFVCTKSLKEDLIPLLLRGK